MYSSQNGVRNIELPENLFSNLGETKKVKATIPQAEQILRNYNIDEDLKLTNYSNRKEYRDRINKMYESINDINPIDNEIDNVLYFNNYIEKGIVVKPKVNSLKQFWTEYRLIKNEKKLPKYHLDEWKIHIKSHNIVRKSKENLSNFDELFEALSIRVTEINKYIDELKEMRTNIDISNNKLEEDKEKLKQEKKRFLDYKHEEEEKIKQEKESLKINYDRLQTIIDDLDKKLNEIDK